MSKKIISLIKLVSFMTLLLVLFSGLAPNASAAITVVSPNGGESWTTGTTKTITWTSSGGMGANLKIELLKSGVLNRIINSNTVNDGSYSWFIPSSQTIGTDFRIKITSITNSSQTDVSNNNFKIVSYITTPVPTSLPIQSPSIAVISPNGGENIVIGSTHTAKWSSDSDQGKYVKLELLKNGIRHSVIASNTSNDGSHSWAIPPTQIPGTDYKIKVISTANSAYTDTSNSNFKIVSLTPPISTVTPIITPKPTPVIPSSGIVINSDKTISVNGKKTFPVFMYDICNSYYELSKMVEPCNPSKNNEFLFSAGGEYYQNFGPTNLKSTYEQTNIFYTMMGSQINSIPQDLINSPNFFGYYHLDEPGLDKLTTIKNTYNTIKIKDPKHPVIMNHWQDMKIWAPYSDILAWDIYPYRTTSSWSREDTLYAYEHLTESSFFKGTSINGITKPVWAVIQADAISGGGSIIMNPKEVRANTYTAITMDAKGIGYWGYLSWSDLVSSPSRPYGTRGLYNNAALHSYYKQVGRELKGINDILVLTTKDYSWQYKKGTLVTFDKTLTKNVLWQTFTNFNYILKQSGTTTYLIVVNKDSRPISNVKMSIANIIGTKSIKTLGLETSGTGRYGRTLSSTNGVFTDSFDGLAVHIYQLS